MMADDVWDAVVAVRVEVSSGVFGEVWPHAIDFRMQGALLLLLLVPGTACPLLIKQQIPANKLKDQASHASQICREHRLDAFALHWP